MQEPIHYRTIADLGGRYARASCPRRRSRSASSTGSTRWNRASARSTSSAVTGARAGAGRRCAARRGHRPRPAARHPLRGQGSLRRGGPAHHCGHPPPRGQRSGPRLHGRRAADAGGYGAARQDHHRAVRLRRRGHQHRPGTPHNPWHPDPHLPGGSSSGTGVAVAVGMAPAGLGTDTGGSVRIPASMCGITGLKTTVGRVSRAGIYPLSWSLDSAGPLTRDAGRRRAGLRGDAGPGPRRRHHPRPSPHDVTSGIGRGVAGLTFGVPRAVFWEDCDTEVEVRTREAIAHLESLGARVIDVEFEQAESARRLNPPGLVIAAEAYAVNGRLLESSFDDLDPVVAFRVEKGRDVPGARVSATVRAWEELRGAYGGGPRRRRRPPLSHGDDPSGAGRRCDGEHRDLRRAQPANAAQHRDRQHPGVVRAERTLWVHFAGTAGRTHDLRQTLRRGPRAPHRPRLAAIDRLHRRRPALDRLG